MQPVRDNYTSQISPSGSSVSPYTTSSAKRQFQGSSESVQKQFRVLNDLERQGITAKLKTLEHRLKQGYNDRDKIELLKTKLCDIESCFQVVKGEKQQALEALSQQDYRIAQLEKELAQEKDLRRRRDDAYEGLKNECEGKKQRLSDIDAKNRKLEQTVKQLESAHASILDSLAHKEIQLHKTQTQGQQQVTELKKKIADLEQHLYTEQSEYAKSLGQYENTFEHMQEANKQLMQFYTQQRQLLQAEQHQNQQLQQDVIQLNRNLADLQEALRARDARIGDLNHMLEQQIQCLQDVEKAMSKFKDNSSPSYPSAKIETPDFL